MRTGDFIKMKQVEEKPFLGIRAEVLSAKIYCVLGNRR